MTASTGNGSTSTGDGPGGSGAAGSGFPGERRAVAAPTARGAGVPGAAVPATSRPARRASTAKRRRRSSAFVMVLALAATGLLWSVLAPGGTAAQQTQAQESNEAERAGRALYAQGCSTCHGLNAQGTSRGPSLIGVGAAAVDFQISTGRMPLAGPAAQAPAKPPVYTRAQIEQIAAYIQSLGGGPEIPEIAEAELRDADLAFGGELYRSNCAQCHQAAGAGAPLTYGKFAPALSEATPVEIVEAMRTGPESMPVFGERQISDEEAIAIANYIVELRDTPSPGGSKLGDYGPVPEGLLAWLVGIGGLLAVAMWIGARQRV